MGSFPEIIIDENERSEFTLDKYCIRYKDWDCYKNQLLQVKIGLMDVRKKVGSFLEIIIDETERTEFTLDKDCIKYKD